jgi:hypothetical protein
MTPISRLLAATIALAALAACQTPAAEQAEADAKPDPRQGEQVSQLCFASQIRNWRELDRRSVIVERGFKDEFRIELVGGCDPRDAFLSIGFVSRVGGGNCLSNGDRLVTDERYAGAICSIRRIYKWNEEAGKPAADSAS